MFHSTLALKTDTSFGGIFELTFRVPYRPVPPLAKHAGTSRSAPWWTHLFSARFRSFWREFGNKTFLNYYGTLPVSFVYSLLSAPRGTWSEIWFFFLSFCDRLATAMSDIESDPQFTVLLDDLEASGAENSDSYSDISVTSVYTCDLTDFDEDSSDSDSDKCASSKCQLESRRFVIAVVWDLRSVEFHTLKTKLFCRFSLYLFLLVLRNLSSNAHFVFLLFCFFSLTDTLVQSSTGHDRMPTLFTHLWNIKHCS